jgi:hypothetical protein
MNQKQVCIVTWEDAYFSMDSAVGSEYVAMYKPAIRKTIGVIFHEDANRVFVAGTVDEPTRGENRHSVADINVIPRGMVKRVERLYSRRLPR